MQSYTFWYKYNSSSGAFNYICSTRNNTNIYFALPNKRKIYYSRELYELLHYHKTYIFIIGANANIPSSYKDKYKCEKIFFFNTLIMMRCL